MMMFLSSSAFILAMMRAGRPWRGMFGLPGNQRQTVLRQVERRHQQRIIVADVRRKRSEN